jgi:N6-adenosine-specific RNA methylase IME4
MKFKVIYADPAWPYNCWNRVDVPRRAKVARGMATMYYPVMKIEDICALPVADIADKDSCLFMWATWPRLEAALQVGKAWGFKYVTDAFMWVKTNPTRGNSFLTKDNGWHFGLGYWTRANTEPCLLFTRGKVRRQVKDVAQLLIAPVGRHSAKPLETYERIERLVEGPYCELFARNTRSGWASLGNEIDGLDLRESLPLLAQGDYQLKAG